jgi:hypothetical protein
MSNKIFVILNRAETEEKPENLKTEVGGQRADEIKS